MGFFRRLVGGGLGVSVAVPFAVLAAPVPTYASGTSGNNALKTIDEFFSPTTSLQVIKGGAGSGLGTASELGGAGLSVSGEVAGVAADGAISLTPVGWAIAAGLGVGAGGYYAWSNRGQILHAVSSVWNSLSSSQQSNLESSNSPGSSISLPTSALSNYLQSINIPLSSGAATYQFANAIVVPSSWPVGVPMSVHFNGSSWSAASGGIWMWGAKSSTSGGSLTYSSISLNGGGDHTWGPGGNTGSRYSGFSGGFWGGEKNPLTWSFSFYVNGVNPGSTLYWAAVGNPVWNANVASWGSAGAPIWYSGDSNFVGVTSLSINAVPATSVPSTVTAPDPSSSSPTFFPGSQSHGQPEPIGVPASHPVASPNTNPLPSGAPSPGFVTFIEDLVVPTANQIEQAVSPLTSAFADRIPFSYVTALIGLMPSWADGLASGGCAAFPIPEFGLNDNSNYHVQICQSSFIGSALSTLKSAFSVLIWMFLLGWGVLMFRRLVR